MHVQPPELNTAQNGNNLVNMNTNTQVHFFQILYLIGINKIQIV